MGDWGTPKLDIARIIVSTTVLIGGSIEEIPNLIFVAGCIFALATIFFFVMGRWQRGRNFVQAHLVESNTGMRIYVLCVIIPMDALLVAGIIFS